MQIKQRHPIFHLEECFDLKKVWIVNYQITQATDRPNLTISDYENFKCTYEPGKLGRIFLVTFRFQQTPSFFVICRNVFFLVTCFSQTLRILRAVDLAGKSFVCQKNTAAKIRRQLLLYNMLCFYCFYNVSKRKRIRNIIFRTKFHNMLLNCRKPFSKLMLSWTLFITFNYTRLTLLCVPSISAALSLTYL